MRRSFVIMALLLLVVGCTKPESPQAVSSAPPPPSGPTYQGAVNIYVKSHADQMVTVVGETPARTVKQIAESLSPRER